MDVWSALQSRREWEAFLQHKVEKQHISKHEMQAISSYIIEGRYIKFVEEMQNDNWKPPFPVKKEINKGGTQKKRTVYSFNGDMNMVLKMIAFCLYCYDDIFALNCYAFRREYGVKDAVRRMRSIKGIANKYCLKTDISNYFNSINTEILLERLEFMKKDNAKIYNLFSDILNADKVWVGDKLVTEKRGAMAGTPVSPFFANVYLMELDYFFEQKRIDYFRYSDDILLFADSEKQLDELKYLLYEKVGSMGLQFNEDKMAEFAPGDPIEFLGFCYSNGDLDLSSSTIRKMKAKIKRKAHALRKWQKRKELSPDKAAKGFINAMNHKFYDRGEGTEFSWSRWFFPNLTTAKGLKELDAYMQQYIRYCVTGRHYKGNYRISYEQMKQWGYRSLVHEYYRKREMDGSRTESITKDR